MIVLRPVTPENYDSALELHVTPEQERFVGPVMQSLADAFVHVGAEVRMACDDDLPVGFVLIFPFELDGEPVVNIVRFLIDARYQGRGLGRESLTATLDWIRSLVPRPQRVRISTLPDNEAALALYRSMGFEDHGMEEGELALWQSLT